MCCVKWMCEKVKKNFGAWDIAALKWCSFLFGAIVGALLAPWILIPKILWLLIVITVLLFIRLIFRFCK